MKAWGVRSNGRILRVLLINKGQDSARIRLRLPTRGLATIVRLLAPSVRSTSGITLAGRHLDSAGNWTGAPAAQTLAPSTQGYKLTVPRFSEALVEVTLRPGALGTARVS